MATSNGVTKPEDSCTQMSQGRQPAGRVAMSVRTNNQRETAGIAPQRLSHCGTDCLV